MLRIYRKPDGQKFEFRYIDKSQVASTITNFLHYNAREFVDPSSQREDGRTADPTNQNPTQAFAPSRVVPADEFAFEWQDGNGVWDDAKPTETVRVLSHSI